MGVFFFFSTVLPVMVIFPLPAVVSMTVNDTLRWIYNQVARVPGCHAALDTLGNKLLDGIDDVGRSFAKLHAKEVRGTELKTICCHLTQGTKLLSFA